MSMMRLVIGAALGFILAQGVLYCLKRFVGWLQRAEVSQWAQRLRLAGGSGFAGGFAKYAGPVAAAVAVIALAAWTIEDYLRTRSAPSAAVAAAADAAAVAADADSVADEVAGLTPASTSEAATAAQVTGVDPYGDASFTCASASCSDFWPPEMSPCTALRPSIRPQVLM